MRRVHLSWERKYQGDERWNKKNQMDKVDAYEKLLETGQLAEIERERLRECRKLIQQIYEMEEIKWKYRAKLNGLGSGMPIPHFSAK